MTAEHPTAEQGFRWPRWGTLLLGSALLVGTPARADIIAPTTGNQAIVRINNPSAVPVDGTINGQSYQVGAHQTIEMTEQAAQIRIVPGTDGMGNQYPDPVVDVETGQNGFISSPPLYTLSDLANTEDVYGQLPAGAKLGIETGGADVTAAIYAMQPDGRLINIALGSYPDGAVLDPQTLFGSLPDGAGIGIQFLQGSGRGVLMAQNGLGDEHYIDLTPRAMPMLGYYCVTKWMKPASKPVKLSLAETAGITDALSAYLLQDPLFKQKFYDAATMKLVLLHWENTDPSDGSFTGSAPLKVANGVLSLFVTPATDVSGLNAKKANGMVKITVGAPNPYGFVQEALAPFVGEHWTQYYGTNVPLLSARPHAAWTKQKPNW